MSKFTKDKPTSRQLVEELGDRLDITICSDVIYELDYEYLQLENKAKKYKEVIDKAINNSQYWIDYYTRLNSDERIALRLQENIDILKEVK